jgi:hypothetical protein
MARDLNELTLRVDHALGGTPVVTVVVDGEDVFRGIHRTRDYIGFHPDDILGSESPLLPSSLPRRVAVYRCNCGEAGCGVVAPLISGGDGVVSWYDFRDFTGVFVQPSADEPLEEDEELDATELPFPEVSFDLKQYREEIDRATASWRNRSGR